MGKFVTKTTDDSILGKRSLIIKLIASTTKTKDDEYRK